MTEKVERVQKEGLEEIRKWIYEILPNEGNVNFLFDKYSTRKDEVEITNNGRNAKNINSSNLMAT